MDKIIKKTETLPIFLAFLYLTSYSFIESDIYQYCYDTLKIIDNILVTASVICFFVKGYKCWDIEALRCFSIIVVLNLLTEATRFLGLSDYYEIYLSILYFFCLSFALTYTIKTDDK